MTERIGQYELLERFAEGGMAEVYFARFVGVEGFRRECALKRLRASHAKDPEHVAMFLREARLAASLLHPNIVQVFDLGEWRGAYFIAMELVDGPHIGRLFAHSLRVGEPLPFEICAWIIAQAADGLHHAHTRVDPRTGRSLGIVHRDMSPQNVLISRWGDVKITDFGIAKNRQDPSHTRVGELKGKLGYLSPEQCHGQPLDKRSDVFALGVMLYELLTRRRLYKRGSAFEVMKRITSEEPLPPAVSDRRIDVELSAIALRALRKEPDQRYQTAAEFGDALSAWLGRRRLADVRAALSFWVRTHAGKIWRTPEERTRLWQLHDTHAEKTGALLDLRSDMMIRSADRRRGMRGLRGRGKAGRTQTVPPLPSHAAAFAAGDFARTDVTPDGSDHPADGAPGELPHGAATMGSVPMPRRPALGVPTTSFIGRRGLVEQITRRLQRGDRWLTLVGPVGVGKSRLALQVLVESGERWRADGGAWRVDLEGADTLAGVLVRVARHLNVALVGVDEVRVAERIGSALASRGRLLLVLDQVDAVADSLAPVLRDWLQRAPDLQLIVAGRAAVGAAEERVLDVPPLSLPEGARLGGSEAVLLFASRAAAARPGFRVGGCDPKVIASLVRQLDGLPLALEFAAARVAVLEPKALLARLQGGLAVLGAEGERSGLSDALSETWDALATESHGAAAQRALANSVVFRGGFEVDAAEAVLGSDALARLDQLQRRSLVRMRPDAVGGAARYQVLHSIRAFVLGRGESTTAAAQAHARFYGGRAARWLQAQHRHGGAVVARKLQMEELNFRAALAWLAAQGVARAGEVEQRVKRTTLAYGAPDAPELALSLAEALLFHAQPGHDPAQRAAIVADAVHAGATGAPLERLRARLALDRGDVGEARRAAERALATATPAAVSDEPVAVSDAELVESYLVLAQVLRAQGAWDAMARCAERAMAQSDEQSIGRCVAILGRAHLERGALQAARGELERAATLLREVGDMAREAAVRTQLARVYLNLGQLHEAQNTIRAALVASQQRGASREAAWLQWLQGRLHLERGEYDAARDVLQAAKSAAELCGDQALGVRVGLALAARSLLLGHPARALAQLTKTASAGLDATAVGRQQPLRHALLTAHAHAALGDLAQADMACRNAQGWLVDDPDANRWDELALAIVALERGQYNATGDEAIAQRAEQRLASVDTPHPAGASERHPSQWVRLSRELLKASSSPSSTAHT